MSMQSQLYNSKTVIHSKLLKLAGAPTVRAKAEAAGIDEGLHSAEITLAEFKDIFEDEAYFTSYRHILIYKYSNLDVETTVLRKSHIIYLRLGAILKLFNLVIPTRKDGVPIFKFDIERGRHKYKTVTDHISSDPTVAIVPNIDWTCDVDTNIKKSRYIVDIFVSVDHVLKTIDDRLSSGAALDMFTFMETFLNGIQVAFNSINAFELQYYEEESEFAIVDREQLDRVPGPFPKIHILNTSSIVKNVQLVSKLSPSITSALSISAQADAYTGTEEGTGFAYLNKGLIDRLFPEKAENSLHNYKDTRNKPASTTTSTTASETEAEERIKITIEGFHKDLRELISKIYKPDSTGQLQFLVEDIPAIQTILRNYYKLLLGNSPDAALTRIIPFELQLTLDGISGMRVMEAFIINEDILPYPYRTKPDETTQVAFLITGLEHAVTTSGWETKIKAQIFLDDSNPPYLGENSIVTGTSTGTSSQETSTETTTTEETAAVEVQRGNPLLAEVIKAAGYEPGTVSYEMALTIGTKEGWDPNANGGVGSRSYRNNNPGNLDFDSRAQTIDPNATMEDNPYGSNRFARFSTAELGAKALVETKIKRWAKSGLPVTTGNQSLLEQAIGRKYSARNKPSFREFMYTYAPPNENNTEGYLSTIVTNLSSKFPNANITSDSIIDDIINQYG